MSERDPLTPAQRRCVTLLLEEGMEDSDIAAAFALSVETVRNHVREARGRLGGSGCGARWWTKVSYRHGHARGYERGYCAGLRAARTAPP